MNSSREPGLSRGGLVWIALAGLLAAILSALLFDDYGRASQSGLAGVLSLSGAAIAVLAACFVWPGLVFALLPSMLILNTTSGLYPFDMAVLALTLVSVIDSLRHRDPRLYGPAALHRAFFIYLAACLPGLFVLREFVPFAGGIKILVVGYCGLLLVMRYSTRPMGPWFALSVPLTGVAISLQLIRNYATRGFHVRSVFLLRTYLSNLGWGTTNYVGAVLTISILGSLALLACGRGLALRLVCAVSLLLMTVSVALLLSRGTIVAVGLGALGMVVVSRGRSRWVLLGVVGIAGLFVSRLAILKVVTARFTQATQMVSYVDRVRLWRDAWDRFLAHPLLGVGLGQGKLQNDALQAGEPHNYFLSVASQLGVVGILAWFLLLVTLVRTVSRGAENAALVRGILVLIFVCILHSCYEPTFPHAQYFFLFFWVVSVLYRQTEPRESEASVGVAAPRA